jgi:hypothetical protein
MKITSIAVLLTFTTLTSPTWAANAVPARVDLARQAITGLDLAYINVIFFNHSYYGLPNANNTKYDKKPDLGKVSEALKNKFDATHNCEMTDSQKLMTSKLSAFLASKYSVNELKDIVAYSKIQFARDQISDLATGNDQPHKPEEMSQVDAELYGMLNIKPHVISFIKSALDNKISTSVSASVMKKTVAVFNGKAKDHCSI